MDALEKWAKRVWKWAVTFPLGLVTAYNIIRAEFFPNSRPLVGLIGGIPSLYLVSGLLLTVLVLIFFDSIWGWAKGKPKRSSDGYVSGSRSGGRASSIGQIGGIVAAGDVYIGEAPPAPGMPTRPTSLKIEPSDNQQNGTDYISIIVHAEPDRDLECYAVLTAVRVDGQARDDLRRRIVQGTNRVSWAYGSDVEVGVKQIDAGGLATLNLARLSPSGLSFEMAKGPIQGDFNDADYEVQVELRGKSGGVAIQPTGILVRFEYSRGHLTAPEMGMRSFSLEVCGAKASD